MRGVGKRAARQHPRRSVWRSALERVPHFLIELLTRLQVIGLVDERSYQMPLTQELIGDALGLSVPHVSRTIGQLREEDLSRLADFERAYLGRYQLSDLFART